MQYHQFSWSVPKALRNADTTPFDLLLPVDDKWKSSKRRLLVIFETVDSEDLASRKLLSSGPQSSLFPQLLRLAKIYSGGIAIPAIAAVNFDYFRNRHLSGTQRTIAQNAAVGRIHALIQKLEPTDIFCFGSMAAQFFLGYNDYEEFFNRGRVTKQDGIYWNHSQSLTDSYQQDSENEEENEAKLGLANLAGFVSRCLGNTLARKRVHQVHLEPKYQVVDTIEKWRKFLAHWQKVKAFALDFETAGVGKIVNTVQTLQIAFNAKCGYIIPIDHKQSPFTKKERQEIRDGCRSVLGKRIPEGSLDHFMLGQNLKFDLTIMRQWLQMQLVYWPVVDLMAAEYLLDENMGANSARLGGRKKTSYSLEWISQFYGCSFYQDNDFGKEDRGNISNRDLSDKGMLRYMAADVQLPWLIFEQEQLRAERQIINGVPYKEAFLKMLKLQMSNMVHVQSMMEHRGDHLDIGWLKSLMLPEGELNKLEREFHKAFHEFPSVQAVNNKLLESAGISSKSIFGKANWLFSVTKPAHKQMLFIEQLQLEAVNFGKTGAASLDKAFQEKHAAVPEVAAFKSLAQVGKVRSTYVQGFLKKLQTDPDMAVDHNLRPSFGYVETVTGRSNSYDPNLQNIIQRGPLAKLIKRAFTAPKGFLTLKLDFSAHEVRMWGITSNDIELCRLFVNGRFLRKMYRKTGKPVFKALMDTIGDIHKINVQTFFQTAPADATKDQRDQVKSVVFGCFSADTIVSTILGPIRIGNLAKDSLTPKVITKAGLCLSSNGAVSRGMKPTVGVLTSHAYLRGTSGHQVMTLTKDCKFIMKPLGKLVPGDAVLYQVGHPGSKIPTLSGRRLTIDDIEAMGLFTADGSANYYNNDNSGNYRLHHGSIGVLETKKVRDFFHRISGVKAPLVISETSKGAAYCICQMNNKEAYTKLLDFGLLCNQHERRVPNSILSAPPTYIAAYLRGFFEGGGGIRNVDRHPQVFATSCNFGLATDVCYMLNMLGIQARIYGPFNRKHVIDGRHIKSNSVEIIISHSTDVTAFIKQVGFITDNKILKATVALSTIQNQTTKHEQSHGRSHLINYVALCKRYALAAGVIRFHRYVKPVIDGVEILPLPKLLHTLIKDIHLYKDAFDTLGMKQEWETLHVLSMRGSYLAIVRALPKDAGRTEVFDVLDVAKEHTWSANGVIVSNSIYGRSARAIAMQIKKDVDLVKNLMKRFFAKFVKAANWLETQKEKAVKFGHTVSPIGRVRHLYLQLYGNDGMRAAAERRGANAPIQGIAADLGHTAAYLFEQHFYEFLLKHKLIEPGRIQSGTTSFVHDAIKSVISYEHFLIAVQIMQWCSTVGLCEYYTKYFGLKFPVEPEIEMEMGASDDSLQKWDWSEKTLRECVHNALEKQASIYKGVDVEGIEREIWKIRDSKIQTDLDERYPVLGDWKEAIHLKAGTKEYETLKKEVLKWRPE